MVSKKLLKSVMYTFMFFLFSGFVFGEIEITRQSCNDGISFVVENTGTYEFRQKDFIITVTHLFSEKTYRLDGVWTNLANNPTLLTSGRQFASNSTFNQYGDFLVNVTRVVQDDSHIVDGRAALLFKESKAFTITCEKQKFECNKINLKINNCYTSNKRFYGIVSGLGEQENFTYDRFNFKFTGRGEILENVSAENTSYGLLGPGKYYVTFPTDSRVGWMTANINGCDATRYQKTYNKIECGFTKECTKDDDCADDEHCNIKQDGVCELTLCDSCQVSKNHVCIDKCEDKNACTKDVCIAELDGKCKNTPITNCCLNESDCGASTLCESKTCTNNLCEIKANKCENTNDTCVIGHCDPAKGCVYAVDPNCRISWLEKTIDWFMGFFGTQRAK